MLFPILTSNPNIRKLSFFYIHSGASPQHQALETSACEDDTVLFGAGTEAGWLISLLAERGRGLSGKIVLMTALLQVAEDLGSAGGGGRF